MVLPFNSQVVLVLHKVAFYFLPDHILLFDFRQEAANKERENRDWKKLTIELFSVLSINPASHLTIARRNGSQTS
jgi:hypothetical protein